MVGLVAGYLLSYLQPAQIGTAARGSSAWARSTL
jgi:hypothetical protein